LIYFTSLRGDIQIPFMPSSRRRSRSVEMSSQYTNRIEPLQKSKGGFFWVFIFFIVMVLVALLGYLYLSGQLTPSMFGLGVSVDDQKSDGEFSLQVVDAPPGKSTSTPRQTDEFSEARSLEMLSKHIVIPPYTESDKPTVGVVRDVESLREKHPFFIDASDGDILAIVVGMAYLYRPSLDRIVKVSAIGEINQSVNADTVVGPQFDFDDSAIESVSVLIIDGSGGSGSDVMVKGVLDEGDNFKSITAGGRSVGSYTETVLVDQSGSTYPNALGYLYSVVGGVVTTTIPQGEMPSNADFVIIIATSTGR
jgi:hypothetical protein